jgi:protein-S-isoprenylcysteine O-methyltransferase Ste14
MNPSLAILVLAGYVLMFALPRVFFRTDGKMNLRWWLTGAPFALSAHATWLTWVGVSPRLVGTHGNATFAAEAAGMLIVVLAVALMAATMATNRVPLALWHQDGDRNTPRQIVTYGPYRWVRHPFYVSFILLSIGAALIVRDAVTFAAVPFGLLSLGWTTRHEEAKLLASSLGAEYGAYRARTGRFFPRLGSSPDGAGDAGAVEGLVHS